MKARLIRDRGVWYVVFSKKRTIEDEDNRGIWLRVDPSDVAHFMPYFQEAGQVREVLGMEAPSP